MSNRQQETKFWCIIPAAGTGSRMHLDLPKQIDSSKKTDPSIPTSQCLTETFDSHFSPQQIPKQYLRILGKTLLEWTIDKLLNVNLFSKIVIVVSEQDQWFREILQPYLVSDRLMIAYGGKERSDSVYAGMCCLEMQPKAQGFQTSDWVMVHDAARPCVLEKDILKLAHQLARDPVGGILATPVADTLKKVTRFDMIQNTVDRHHLYQAQTPQMFRYVILKKAIENACRNNFLVTDEANAVEMLNYQAKIVLGSRQNIKVTYAEDLSLAELILEMQQKEKLE